MKPRRLPLSWHLVGFLYHANVIITYPWNMWIIMKTWNTFVKKTWTYLYHENMWSSFTTKHMDAFIMKKTVRFHYHEYKWLPLVWKQRPWNKWNGQESRPKHKVLSRSVTGHKLFACGYIYYLVGVITLWGMIFYHACIQGWFLGMITRTDKHVYPFGVSYGQICK